METSRKSSKDIILIVDDQQNNLKVLSSVLSKDYSLSVANSGIKALSILEKMKPELILLDVMMPEMDGFEVCKRLKESEELKDIPVIFLTAKSDIEDIIKGFDIGAVDYITKPFNFSELQVRIKNHLNLAHAKQTIIEQKAELERFNFQLLEAQDELQKLNEDLIYAHDAVEEHANKVNTMNQKLLESEYKLRRANQELQLINNEKDKFFSIIAHDLKSPFSGLLGLLEMLNDNTEVINEAERSEMLNALYESAKNVFMLLENLLEWSRVKRNTIKYNPRTIIPAKIMGSVMKVLMPQAAYKKIKVESSISDDIKILADEMMVNTVFRNLVSNAIKFTPNGGSVKVESSETDDNIEFRIIDNGVGMDEETVGKLFRIDEHISKLGTANEKGTGLGLILCKEFINMHGGKIIVESKVGEGSTFIVVLPNKKMFF